LGGRRLAPLARNRARAVALGVRANTAAFGGRPGTGVRALPALARRSCRDCHRLLLVAGRHRSDRHDRERQSAQRSCGQRRAPWSASPMPRLEEVLRGPHVVDRDARLRVRRTRLGGEVIGACPLPTDVAATTRILVRQRRLSQSSGGRYRRRPGSPKPMATFADSWRYAARVAGRRSESAASAPACRTSSQGIRTTARHRL